MTLDPEIVDFIRSNESFDPAHLDHVGQREYMRLLLDLNFLQFGRPGPTVHDVVDHAIPAPSGSVIARLYYPGAQQRLPAHVTLHGGAWWHGSINDLINDALARQRCVEANVVIVAVEYRLAPEHPFPAGLDDAQAALLWLRASADELRIDPENISIGGNSAGGNLAAALAIKLGREGFPIVLQLLEVPVLDLTIETAVKTTTIPEANQLVDELAIAVQRYLPDQATARDPLASPAFATFLGDLPPTVILTAEHDPLHTEGEKYAERIAADGGVARARRQAGAIHEAPFLTRTWAPARRWQSQVAEWLRLAHWHPADLHRRLTGPH